MKIRNIIAIYSLFIGILMIGMWGMFILTGQVPEMATKPAEIMLHLLAEFTTAILLIMWRNRPFKEDENRLQP